MGSLGLYMQGADQKAKGEVTAETMISSLAGAAAVCAVSQRLAAWLGSPAWAYALTAVLASGLASVMGALLPSKLQPFAGSPHFTSLLIGFKLMNLLSVPSSLPALPLFRGLLNISSHNLQELNFIAPLMLPNHTQQMTEGEPGFAL